MPQNGWGFFLREGYQLEIVSKILGHSSVRTTEQHYVKIITSATAMKRVARQLQQGGIRLQSQLIALSFQQSTLNPIYKAC